MIPGDRRAHLLWCWENETSSEDEDWRDDLTEEEQKLIDRWDARYTDGIARMCGGGTDNG